MDYSYKNIWRISFPIIISMLLQQLIGITDVIYLGRVSTVALGASGLGSTYFFAFFMLISGFSFGAQIIISRRNGEKNYHEIAPVLYQGTLFLVLGACCLTILSKYLSPHIFKNIISDHQILNATLSYTNWRILGLIATSFLMMFRSFFVGIAETFVLQIISLSMVVSNVILNYFFIFGYSFIPPLGVKGAAIASVISEGLAVFVFVIYLILKTDLKKYGFHRFVFKNIKLLKSILNLSFWTMTQQFVSVGTWFLFFIAVEHLGSDELAISNILKNSAGIPWILVVSFASAAGTITGNLIGAGKEDDILKANKKIIFLNTCILSSLLILFAFFYYPILRIYSNDIVLIKKAIPSYFTALLCYLPLFSGFIWFQDVAATGNAKYTMYIELISMIFYMLFIVIFILWLKSPLYICMFSDGIYNLVIFIMSYRFMYSLKWIGKKV